MAEVLVFQVADAVICAQIFMLADQTLDAGIEICRQMDPPGTEQAVIDFGGVSHALQAVITQARRRGIGDNEVFCALSTAIGAFAKHQQLGSVTSVVAQLANNGVKAAYAVSEIEAEALPPLGGRMSRDWTIAGLAAVYALSAASMSLGEIAEAVGRTRGEVDLALWYLVGHTPDEALQVLAKAAPPSRPPSAAAVKRFIRETHP